MTTYAEVARLLAVNPLAEAIAVTVADDVSVNDPPDVIAVPCVPGTGVLPSVVYVIVAPLVASVTVTVTELVYVPAAGVICGVAACALAPDEYVHVTISWIAVEPPVPPVNPTYPVFPPITPGILMFANVFVNTFPVVTSVTVINKFVPSYAM